MSAASRVRAIAEVHRPAAIQPLARLVTAETTQDDENENENDTEPINEAMSTRTRAPLGYALNTARTSASSISFPR